MDELNMDPIYRTLNTKYIDASASKKKYYPLVLT